MRHGGRTDFTGFGFLLEVTDGDITPEIAVQVQQNRVSTGKGIEHFCHVVMRFDLDGVRVVHQTQTLLDHSFGEAFPVMLRIGRQVRIVVADRAIHFAEDFDFGDTVCSAAQTGNHVGQFFTQRARAGWLTVCAGKHRYFCIQMCQFRQFADQFVQRRQHHIVTRGFQHHAVRSVVDVFGCAGEVNEFAGSDQFCGTGDFFFQPVFDRFHVMVGDGFDFFDALCIGFGKFADQTVQQRYRIRRERTDFAKAGFRQSLQPRHFHFHTVVHETGFGQGAAQSVNFGGVTAVNRGQSRKRR